MNLRLANFLAELNNLQLWGAEVGNALLQALTKEKLYIVAGPEFEELHGHVLDMHKALCGKRSGEHVSMTSCLIFFNRWDSSHQKQTWTYG